MPRALGKLEGGPWGEVPPRGALLEEEQHNIWPLWKKNPPETATRQWKVVGNTTKHPAFSAFCFVQA